LGKGKVYSLEEIERLGGREAAMNVGLACQYLNELLGKRDLRPSIVYIGINGKVGQFEWRDGEYEFVGYILDIED